MKKLRIFQFIFVMISLCSTLSAQGKPVQLALFNPIQLFSENTSITGLRLSLIYGKNTSVTGLDWGLVSHTTSGTSTGVQFGFLGINEADFIGWQDTGININHGSFEGLQLGLVNYAGAVNGVQIGFVNYAANMKKGLQIGIVNIIKQGGQFPFFPIVNWAL